jgi:uncharacterized protein involved in exopolysaccharide biosynthesis
LPIDTHSSQAPLDDAQYLIGERAGRAIEVPGMYRAVELLWDKRRLLLRWVLAGAALALVLAIAVPSKFESTTRILPSDSTSGTAMMMASGAAAGAGLPNLGMMSDLLGMKTPGALCAAILRSDTVLDAVINRLDLRKVYYVKTYDKAREKLSDRTVISDDKKSGIVTLTVTDHHPNRAAAIANAYVAELDRVLQNLNTSAAHREREFLEQRIEVVRENLTEAEKLLGQYSSKNSALDIKEQGRAAFEVAGKVEGELIVAQSELQGLRQIYGPDHPRVKSAEARVSQLRAAADKLGTTSSTGGDDLKFLSISRLPMVGVAYADLFREVKVQEAIYEALLKQYEISKVEEVKETPRLKVIDYGQVPTRRSSPRLLVLAVLCIWGFLVIGIIAVLVKSQWDDASDENPWKRLGIRATCDLRKAVLRTPNGSPDGGAPV